MPQGDSPPGFGRALNYIRASLAQLRCILQLLYIEALSSWYLGIDNQLGDEPMESIETITVVRIDIKER